MEIYTRTDMPLQWARTQSNLAHALRTLGEREGSAARLEEAVAAYRAALEVNTRAESATDWTRRNLARTEALLEEYQKRVSSKS